MKTSTCQYCVKLFTPTVGSYGKFCSLSCGNFFRALVNKIKKIEIYNKNPKICKVCSIPLEYDKRKNQFCSHSCSAKVSNQIKRKRGPKAKDKIEFCSIKFICCKTTYKWYSNRKPDGTIRKSSPYVKTLKERYYSSARFKFNVYNFPNEFDLNLIEQYGWYTCPGKKRKNSNKNINGVSRDHIISVSYGYKNNIDPKIISHPANCRIIKHSENKKKSTDCQMTIDELLSKIEIWNKKYTERRIGLEPMTSNLEG